MAHANHNSITHGYGGLFGNIVFRWVYGQSVMQTRPDFSNVRWSKAQKANRKRFGEAMRYAQQAIKDPEKKMFYKKKAKGRCSACNKAVSDYMLKPKIESISMEEYHGKKGDTIRVDAYDKYGVVAVLVFILNALGQEIESGMAVRDLSDGLWIYQAAEDLPPGRPGRVVVRAIDHAGNSVAEVVPVIRM
jgi:hypothetical protein